MTKAEQKKLETEKKYDFIAKTYAVILSSIPEQTKGVRKSVQVRLTHQNYTRYIRFHNYGKDMNFQLYSDGNVVIELDEALHNKHTETLFEYSGDDEKQEAFWEELSKLVPRLIKVFIGQEVMDFHSYMDYVGDKTTAAAAYQTMMDEYHGHYASE